MRIIVQKTLMILSIPLLMWSCTVNRTTNLKVTDAYQKDPVSDRLKAGLWHVSENLTRLYLEVDPGKLLYKKDLSAQLFKSKYTVHYELYNLETPKIVTDSLTKSYTDSLQYENRAILMDSLDIFVPSRGRYILQVKLTDLYSKSENVIYLNLDNSNALNRQNFQARKSDGGFLFEPYQKSPQEPFYLRFNNKQIPRLFVRYYKREYPIALPPFEERRAKTFSFKPDSVFFIELNEGISGPLVFAAKGIYHIQTDTSVREGYTFFSFYKGFPKVTNASQMLLPLRYICSKSEFNDMMLMKNSKEAVDDFWLDCAGNPDRAKELIRKYYSRVETANQYFTSYQEGWKTDRGMIYIVYGPPGIVYRNPDDETWIYGEDRNVLSITFNFKVVENPFSMNDYELVRTLEYKETWYSALDGWRNQ